MPLLRLMNDASSRLTCWLSGLRRAPDTRSTASRPGIAVLVTWGRLFWGLAGCMVLLTPEVANAQACGMRGGLPPRSQALALAVRGQIDEGLKIAPDHFIAGYVAYIGKRHDLALQHLAQFAVRVQREPNRNRRSEMLAKAGYWSTRILNETGRTAEAEVMRQATLRHPGTFYALLTDETNAIPARTNYPAPQFIYTDARASRALVLAITREESRFNPRALSHAGAQGMMQVMPGTARRVAGWANVPVDMARVRSDPHYNVALGSTYLGFLLDRYRNYPPLAAAGYNAGEGCADRWIQALGDPRGQVDPLLWIEAIPIQETREYIKKVMASYTIYRSHGSR
jgi:soluble lytic murein transglycosylase-like protein